MSAGTVDQYTFTFASGSSYQNKVFAFFQYIVPITNNALVTGKVYMDKNQNYFFDVNGADNVPATVEDNDVLLTSIPMHLYGTREADGAIISRSTSTNTDGKYQFTDLPRGNYSIWPDMP